MITDVNVCIGSEWHRFPSSFFLPSPEYQVKWLDDGFRGLLPLPFNESIGGSAAAPFYFNKLNQASKVQFVWFQILMLDAFDLIDSTVIIMGINHK